MTQKKDNEKNMQILTKPFNKKPFYDIISHHGRLLKFLQFSSVQQAHFQSEHSILKF